MRRPVFALTVLAALAMPAAAQQQHMNMPGMNMEDVFSNKPFRPGLGELMTAFVQPRHTKLGLAGAAGNWDYAAYELDQLRGIFDDVGKFVLKHGELSIPQAITATMSQPTDALDKAIKAKDAAGFTKAYADLTAGCNACHQSAGHAMIVIKVPDVAGTAYPDQDFGAKK